MPIVDHASTADRYTGPRRVQDPAVFPRTRRKVATDPYSKAFAKYAPVEIDPYQFPTGALAGLGDTGTGIAFVDDNLKAIRDQVEQAATAAKLTSYFAIAGGLASVLLLFRTRNL